MGAVVAPPQMAYVTGGGQGIGRAFAHALGEAGAKVAVVDLVLAKAEEVVCELSLKGKQGTDLQVLLYAYMIPDLVSRDTLH
uniref:Uncharacterized protein n=1 Tax=Strigops habroptila TaxID=2489341 RepID=A0A672UDZ3_STRHB